MPKPISQSAKFLRILCLLLLALPLAVFVMVGKRFFKSAEAGYISGIIPQASADVPPGPPPEPPPPEQCACQFACEQCGCVQQCEFNSVGSCEAGASASDSDSESDSK